jgi:hypothetical protein
MLAADPRPGCPARRSPATGSSSPVARFGLPSAPPSPPKVHRRRKRIILLPAPLAPREPGWPSTSPRPPLLAAAVRWHRSSGSGWRCGRCACCEFVPLREYNCLQFHPAERPSICRSVRRVRLIGAHLGHDP